MPFLPFATETSVTFHLCLHSVFHTPAPCLVTSRLTHTDGPLASGSIQVMGTPTMLAWRRVNHLFLGDPLPGQLWASAEGCSPSQVALPNSSLWGG